MYTKLFGNGIDDDHFALQAILDKKEPELRLPMPQKEYLIGKTLKIHSGQHLILPRFAVIKLKDGANCLMITNSNPHSDKNIIIEGGIWDMNNINQQPNPFRFPLEHINNPEYHKWPHNSEPLCSNWNENARTSNNFLDVYSGIAMQFNGIENFSFKNLTLKNPVTYGVQVANLRNFLFDNITFEFYNGSPKLWNMDGIHLEGNCFNGAIQNLFGNTHDDLVALTANDSLDGPIENVSIRNIFAGDCCHSAVRLLSNNTTTPIKNITISNVYGSFYTYCIGITKYRGSDEIKGEFENIFISNVYAKTCAGTKDVEGGVYPFIFVEGGLNIKNLSLENIHRYKSGFNNPTIRIGKSNIENLTLYNITHDFGDETKFLVNDAQINNLTNINCKL